MSQRMSLYCKLVPVQYREYEYGLLKTRAEMPLFALVQPLIGWKFLQRQGEPGLRWGCGLIWEQMGTSMLESLAQLTGTGFLTNQLLEGKVTLLPETNFLQMKKVEFPYFLVTRDQSRKSVSLNFSNFSPTDRVFFSWFSVFFRNINFHDPGRVALVWQKSRQLGKRDWIIRVIIFFNFEWAE